MKNAGLMPSNYAAQKYSEYRVDFTPYLKKIFNWISTHKQGGKILDIGCADGGFLAKFDKQTWKKFGIDVSAKAISAAKHKGIQAKVCDITKGITFPANSFDVVVAAEVIEHIYDTDFFLKEIRRILKPNGIFAVSTPNIASLANRIKLIFGSYPNFCEYDLSESAAGHIRVYTLPALVNQLKKNQFKILHKTSPNLIFPMYVRLLAPFRPIMMKLGDVFPSLGAQAIIFCQK
jgi:methionine biosynthesis protein MetW